ncbi:hypothetical protein [Candidatus Rariloculus sp.]
MAMDELSLTTRQRRKLKALGELLGEELGEEVVGKWIVWQDAPPSRTV